MLRAGPPRRGASLVALDVSAYVFGGQQLHVDAESGKITRPVMGRTAGLYDDERDVAVVEPALELAASEMVGFDDFPGSIGHGKLENGLGKVNGYGSRLHVGLQWHYLKRNLITNNEIKAG